MFHNDFNIASIQENMIFSMMGEEFKYLHSTIEILLKNYSNDFEQEDEKFKNEIEKLKESGEYYEPLEEEYAPEVTVGQMMEYNLQEPFWKLESFLSIIVESLLIKHLAYIEDILIKFSFMVQRQEKEVIPPDYGVNGKFTDMLRAVDYIKKITNYSIDLKSLKHWKIIKHLRQLRHELAHGQRNFELKEGIIDDINKEVYIINKQMFVLKNFNTNKGLADYSYEASNQPTDPNNIWNCSINGDLNSLLMINKICTAFVEDIKNMYSIKYRVLNFNGIQ